MHLPSLHGIPPWPADHPGLPPARGDLSGATGGKRVVTLRLLLRAASDGGIGREVVDGRVLYHDRIREALMRHVEADLGTMALPPPFLARAGAAARPES